jgi:phage host-nuclease inhibitor protein Gam
MNATMNDLHGGCEMSDTTASTDSTETETAPAFVVHDEWSAAWAADKILTARERLARIKASCQAMIEAASRDAEEAESLFLPQLEAWAMANPPRKGKTIRLPTGNLAFRTVPGGPRVVDEAAALDWAKAELASAVIVTERVDKSAIKDYIKVSREVPPGVEIVEPRESFTVNTEKP